MFAFSLESIGMTEADFLDDGEPLIPLPGEEGYEEYEKMVRKFSYQRLNGGDNATTIFNGIQSTTIKKRV